MRERRLSVCWVTRRRRRVIQMRAATTMAARKAMRLMRRPGVHQGGAFNRRMEVGSGRRRRAVEGTARKPWSALLSIWQMPERVTSVPGR